MNWTNEPEDYKIQNGRIEIVTSPHTDLWQRTYYHFRNDNAPMYQMDTEDNTGKTVPALYANIPIKNINHNVK